MVDHCQTPAVWALKIASPAKYGPRTSVTGLFATTSRDVDCDESV